MSQEKPPPGQPPVSARGLLSKVARFVRHPTVNWSELDALDEERESQYSRQMLKEMIERKRRNDFVRRREFDQLRKLRSSEGERALPPEDAAARTSFFQTSITSPDERADTLRKIDEIEAQMSHQWWKGRAPAPDAGAAPPPPVAAPAAAGPQPSPAAQAMAAALADSPFAGSEHARAFAPTAPLSLPGALAGVGGPLVPPLQPGAVPQARAPQVPPHTFVHDPDLEEAAIRFAGADYAGAEAALRDVLSRRELSDEAAREVWLTLFDLYRATGQQQAFESLALDYAGRFHRTAPLWFSLPQQLGLAAAQGPAAPDASAREFCWNAPPVISPQSVAALQVSLGRAAQPWTLSWSRLSDIEAPAVRVLAELIERLAGERVQLRFSGLPTLQTVLHAHTLSGDRGQDPQWWRLRMAFLRLMWLPDEFELVALDYCVTYEISPPSWEAPRCSFSSDAEAPLPTLNASALPRSGDSYLPALNSGFALSMPPGGEEGPVPSLLGHIEGDASAVLQSLQELVHPGVPLVVACDQLIRIDFAAGGGVLNWVVTQQAAGCQVEFRQLHRLVAVFFNVISIGEHAHVVARSD
ncbi:hypothetical protein SAMN05428957_103431 [Oryzisolibacter propanilivorax]|uniref:MlaB-like STAS domain-containing protein n=1 Tax=Oryzisolibacter propanilivorax TaxID=1527607 RepID=A0A1G9RQU3_9BURK|nr:STAS domain-containing protein [Oryzisolibacter propanilivorax]SDM25591.1 hypothetical protein SAMN05428957_103431 [Oryzisolibacter propanilivorax]